MEAYERGTSVYLTDRVVPMIPQTIIKWDLFAKPTCSTFNHEL